jgi:hypothetical protein
VRLCKEIAALASSQRTGSVMTAVAASRHDGCI